MGGAVVRRRRLAALVLSGAALAGCAVNGDPLSPVPEVPVRTVVAPPQTLPSTDWRGAWQPPPGALPGDGTFAYFEERTNAGIERTSAYPVANALFHVREDSSRRLRIDIGGGTTLGSWSADVWDDRPGARLQVGLQRDVADSYTPGTVSASWAANAGVLGGRECGAVAGWYAIDELRHTAAGVLDAVTIRFEQRCTNDPSTKRGVVRWRATDVVPPAPPTPIPSGLWRPDPGAVPATGNAAYFLSGPGDLIGNNDAPVLLTAADTQFSVTASGHGASIALRGPQWWFGAAHPGAHQPKLAVGYYDRINTTADRGVASWTRHASCDAPAGWFVVDEVAYAGEQLTALTARFELTCAGPGRGPFRAYLRWRA